MNEELINEYNDGNDEKGRDDFQNTQPLLACAREGKLWEEKFKMRVGRGAIQDVEIREVGGPIVRGEIPGVVALVGCANYPHSGKEVAEIAEEFVKRRFIVVTSGCADIPITMKDEVLKILEEKGWKETRIPDPTLLPRLVRKRTE